LLRSAVKGKQGAAESLANGAAKFAARGRSQQQGDSSANGKPGQQPWNCPAGIGLPISSVRMLMVCHVRLLRLSWMSSGVNSRAAD